MSGKKIFSRWILSMTTKLETVIVWDATAPDEAEQLIDEAFYEAQRIIGIISAWQEDTELAEVNRQAGKRPVRVSRELFTLIRRSLKISEMTGGLFDVTFASIDKVWFFDRPMKVLPAPEAIAASVSNINYRFIELDESDSSILITNPGTRIELGAIGKGYIAGKMKEKLRSLGVEGGLVNAGGDLTCWGRNERNDIWRVGITDPEKKSSYLAWLPIENQSVATSGSYERFAEINGHRYSHIIHPKTGYPVKGIRSVTIISPDAELCDAIATSVFLLGAEEGLTFVNRFNDLQCFIIDDNNNWFFSDNLKNVPYEIKAVQA